MNQQNQERFWTVKGINLFQHLPAKAIRERTLKTIELDRYQPIHHADELGEIVYLVEVGRVKLQSPAEGSIFDDESSEEQEHTCLLYTSPSPRDRTRSRMPSSA